MLGCCCSSDVHDDLDARPGAGGQCRWSGTEGENLWPLSADFSAYEVELQASFQYELQAPGATREFVRTIRKRPWKEPGSLEEENGAITSRFCKLLQLHAYLGRDSFKVSPALGHAAWMNCGAIFTVEFDDGALTLKLVKKTDIPQDEPISWITFDHARKNIYGASMKKWSSHTVKSPTDITHDLSHPMSHHPLAPSKDTRTRAIFVLAAKKPPHCVYGNPFYEHAGHGNVFSVDSDGKLDKNIQNYEYSEKSAIHGMVFDAAEEYLYSADMWGDKIWCHKKDADTGQLTLVGSVDAVIPGDHPRWVELHPSGAYLYALNEAGNSLSVFLIDEKTHMPVYTRMTFPLVPPGIPNLKKMYRADVVFCSQSGQYLFATARSNSPSLTGYISAFKLGPAGNIERQICLNPTPTSGGHSNAVSPCPWTDEWLALTDDEQGFVEIYRWHEEYLARVAHLDIKEPGFGMNAIWYD